MKRLNISSGAKWESIVGYSRAVQVGNYIEIAGTVSNDDNGVVHEGDVYLQSVFILNKVKSTLEQMGAGLKDVVRTRMFVVDIEQWEEIGKAHGEFFKGINPVTTMVEVSRLIDPKYLVEIEVSAIITDS